MPDSEHPERFVPALAYRRLTPLYDPLVRLTTREGTFKAALVEQAEIGPGMTVLDLGCGTGTLAIQAKRAEPAAEISGLDGDPEMLTRAERKSREAGAEVSFDQGMSFELPYAEGSFDRVLSSLFFHHLTERDKRRTLAEVRRVLRPGGELHVADWGMPTGPVMRVLSWSIAALDGREQTADNLDGRLPGIIREAGFPSVRLGPSFRTMFGTLALVAAEGA